MLIGRQFSDKPGIFRASVDDSKATLLIYDEFGSDPDLFPVNPTAFALALESVSGASEITLRINSPGGDVFAGVAMYNLLRQFAGKKIAQIDGLCASIASVFAMGADEIRMADTAMLMIHNPHVITGGDAPKIRNTADLLDQVAEATMIPAYERSGKSVDEIKAIMAKTVYYSANQAKSEGWIDTILELPKPERLAARVHFDLKALGCDRPKALAVAVDSCACPCGPCMDGDCAACDHAGCDCAGCADCPMSALAKAKADEASQAAAEAAENDKISAGMKEKALIRARYRAENLRLASES